jgi:octaprenyl-diphosphate synthase
VKPVAQVHSTPVLHVPPDVVEDLARVETRLAEELYAREPRLTEIATHLVDAGGKRVRPMVVLLVAHAAADGRLRRRDDVIEAAVALELIHSATLLHDDIIDGGEMRRGKPSALAVFGLGDTLVAGDFLFCRAFALCARFEPQVIRWAAEACVALTEGEILQARFRRNPTVTVADYLEIIDRKTASLFATGARTAAHLADASGDVVAAMAACGLHVGRAFQMQDDLLDVEGSTSRTGKPRGLDLRDGNPSLPIVLALDQDSEVRRIFSTPQPTPADIDTGLARIRRTNVCRTVGERARTELDAALAALSTLPQSAARSALDVLAQALGERSA